MGDTIVNDEGGYRFAKGVFQYSAGVCAEPGYRLERAQMRTPPGLRDGLARIADHLAAKGRPNKALCAIELRCPAPLSEQEFLDFNRAYVAELGRIGIEFGEQNPIARTKVAPKVSPPSEPVIWAFSYTVVDHDDDGTRDFVIAGSGEAPEGKGNYRDHIIRPGDTTPEGIREKANWVLGEMERRMRCFGKCWSDATTAQLYTLHPVHHLIERDFAGRGAMTRGVLWHYACPPVAALDYEMDVRSVRLESMI